MREQLAKSSLALWLSVVVALGLTVGWLCVAEKKPLWNDEIYTQVGSIEANTYGQIMAGKLDEGNKSPLFYVMQKAWVQAAGYRSPQAWRESNWQYDHPSSNVVLRFLPVLCMAAGVTVMFYYFMSRWGAAAGIYGLLVSLSSFMVWQYAPEARPYALWFLLTALQMVLVMCWMDGRDHRTNRYVWGLAAVQVLLAFTVMFSLVQNVVACAVLCVAGLRRPWMYVPLLGVPFAVTAYYAHVSVDMPFWFKEGFMGLLGASLPQDRLAIIGAGALMMAWAAFRSPDGTHMRRFWLPLLYTALIFAGCIAVLLKFKLAAVPAGDKGYPVSNRYFMLLTPPGIMMTVIASYYLVTLTKGMARRAVWGALAALMALRMYKTYKLVIMGQTMMFFHKG